MMNTIRQDTDLWEVWIEYDQFHPENFGTLYVHGEISADKKNRSSFKKLSVIDGVLILQLPVRNNEDTCTREVVYSESIKNLNQYTSVSIYSGNELIGHFDEIEVMI